MGDGVVELVGPDPESAGDVVVDHHVPAVGDGTHRELGMPGGADLADHQRVEVGAQGVGHLTGHRHPAACQPEYDDVTRIGHHVGDQPAQMPPGRPPVGENMIRRQTVRLRMWHGCRRTQVWMAAPVRTVKLGTSASFIVAS